MGASPPPASTAMAVSKSLFASLAVALLALLSVAAVSPADAAVAVRAASDPQAVRIEGRSHAFEEPALAPLTLHQRAVKAASCSGYFQCGSETVNVEAKNSHTCYFKIAKRGASGGGSCNPLPYNCGPSNCVGWRKCTCDQCKTVKFTVPIYCELP